MLQGNRKVIGKDGEGMEVSHLFASKGEALWKQVIDGKFRKEGGWHTCKMRDDYSVALWKLTKKGKLQF